MVVDAGKRVMLVGEGGILGRSLVIRCSWAKDVLMTARNLAWGLSWEGKGPRDETYYLKRTTNHTITHGLRSGLMKYDDGVINYLLFSSLLQSSSCCCCCLSPCPHWLYLDKALDHNPCRLAGLANEAVICALFLPYRLSAPVVLTSTDGGTSPSKYFPMAPKPGRKPFKASLPVIDYKGGL